MISSKIIPVVRILGLGSIFRCHEYFLYCRRYDSLLFKKYCTIKKIKNYAYIQRGSDLRVLYSDHYSSRYLNIKFINNLSRHFWVSYGPDGPVINVIGFFFFFVAVVNNIFVKVEIKFIAKQSESKQMTNSKV